MAGLDDLLAVLGPTATRAYAQRLLAEADGSVEDAVTLHLHRDSQPGPSNQGSEKVQQLKQILGNHISNQSLEALLKSHGGNVEAAVNAHFSGAGDPMQVDQDDDDDVIVIGMCALNPTVRASVLTWRHQPAPTKINEQHRHGLCSTLA